MVLRPYIFISSLGILRDATHNRLRKYSVMKFVRPLIILAIALAAILVLSSCGTSSSSATSSNVTGNWSGALTNTTGQAVFNFTMSLNQAATDTVSATNISFTSGAPCFQNISGDSGTFTLNGTFNGLTTNTLQLTVLGSQPGEPDFNTLTLNGSVSASSISGAWALQGPATGCVGNGTFTMTRTK